jgi:hypothetical protein
MVPVFSMCDDCGQWRSCKRYQFGTFCQCCVEAAESRELEQREAERRSQPAKGK